MPIRSVPQPEANGDAGSASGPELVHSDHNSYLSAPIDPRATKSRKTDKLDHEHELALEMDGEWFGDAQEAASSVAQKVSLVTRRVLRPLLPLRKPYLTPTEQLYYL